jgi:DNA gyrase/topoisomerase IV subunit B
MDRFVVRLPRDRDGHNNTKYSNSKKSNKQRTLESLSGVVIIQDIHKQKKILESSSRSSEDKLSVLEELSGKSPGTQILIETGIGKTVNRLRKDTDTSISIAAEQLYIQWKQLLETRVEKSQQNIEVKSDLETERLRTCSNRFLQKSLEANLIRDSKETAALIEKHIYKTSNRLVGKDYRRLSRKVVFALKREEYKNATISPDQAKQIVQSNRV